MLIIFQRTARNSKNNAKMFASINLLIFGPMSVGETHFMLNANAQMKVFTKSLDLLARILNALQSLNKNQSQTALEPEVNFYAISLYLSYFIYIMCAMFQPANYSIFLT